MNKKIKRRRIKKIYLIILSILVVTILCSLFLIIFIMETPTKIIENQSQNNSSYYYIVNAYRIGDITTIEINNSCIYLMDAKGNSMKPFFSNHTLLVLDLCYPVEKLKIGDIILFKPQFLNQSVNHRIIDINYEKRYVITKGDGNDGEDDFYSFNDIEGKTIGFLNIYDDLVNKSEVLQ